MTFHFAPLAFMDSNLASSSAVKTTLDGLWPLVLGWFMGLSPLAFGGSAVLSPLVLDSLADLFLDADLVLAALSLDAALALAAFDPLTLASSFVLLGMEFPFALLAALALPGLECAPLPSRRLAGLEASACGDDL